jgi:glycosyltransferase involved in cell wall biosynthesis
MQIINEAANMAELALQLPSSLASACELTILMPCLNEAETLAICIDKAKLFLENAKIFGEVLIADNGSQDGSPEIAMAHGARVVYVAQRGYGAALQEGIRAAKGRFIIMGDADDSYDFANLEGFVAHLKNGADLVMGNRFHSGGIASGAMPWLHRYLGNPVLSGIGRLFFSSPIRDFHCGLRGFRRNAILGLDLRTCGMEFASEMIVKATIYGLRIDEVPTTLSPDGRSRSPHLRTWRDGWRHLRFLLLYSPRWLFFYPGLTMFLLGAVLMTWLLAGPRHIVGVVLDIHTLLAASGLLLIGVQILTFAVFSKAYGVDKGYLPGDPLFTRAMQNSSLEAGLIVGLALMLIGLGIGYSAFVGWKEVAFGPQNPQTLMRLLIPSLTLIEIGVQVVFSAFFLKILNIDGKRP